MRKPVASSKANSSVIMVVDGKTGKQKYYVRNRLTVNENDLDVWDLARRRYRRAIRIFREKIDDMLRKECPNVPVYRDSDVSDILTLMRQGETALSIYRFIQDNNGKQEDFPRRGE
jgi:hypothetical protein